MSLISKIYTKIALLSPVIEVLLRKLYWSNIRIFKKYNPNKPKSYRELRISENVDFSMIENWLINHGVKPGCLLIVHSSYYELECTGLSPDEIIDRLLSLVGPSGTLAMPVIRKYKEVANIEDNSKVIETTVCKYDVKRTMVISGLLPYSLKRRGDAHICHHPLNPLCAVGPLAKNMMAHCLDGDAPSPHGPNSCWKYCYDHNAIVCSLGTDLEHHNTIMHVAEEGFNDWYWDDNEWYRKRPFLIIDENKNTEYKYVKERRPEWGTKHLAELNMCRDLKKYGILQSDLIDQKIQIGLVDSNQLIEFFRKRNAKGYPYVK